MQVTYLGVSHPPELFMDNRIQIPLYADAVTADISSPVQDVVEKTINLNELFIKTPSATFFVRVQGGSMIEAGIFHGDVLVVDRSLTARHKDVVIACINGEMTIKSLELKPNVLLRPKNKAYRAIEINDDSRLEITGVVVSVVRNVKRDSESNIN